MTTERSEAIARFFEDQGGLQRTPGDAAALTTERLDVLAQELETAGELGEDADQGARGDREGSIHATAIALGRSCVDALNGLVVSGAINMPGLTQARLEAEAPPLDDSWQKADNPFIALAEVVTGQKEELVRLSEQPNQLYRRLHEPLALAADVAAWTAWTQL